MEVRHAFDRVSVGLSVFVSVCLPVCLSGDRSAAFAEQDEFANALRDAQYCVFLKPDWANGYSRLALALYNLGRYPECLQAVEGGLKLDPENSVLKPMMEGLKLVQILQSTLYIEHYIANALGH